MNTKHPLLRLTIRLQTRHSKRGRRYHLGQPKAKSASRWKPSSPQSNLLRVCPTVLPLMGTWPSMTHMQLPHDVSVKLKPPFEFCPHQQGQSQIDGHPTSPSSRTAPSVLQLPKRHQPEEDNQNNSKDLSHVTSGANIKGAAHPPTLEAVRKATRDLPWMWLQNSEVPGRNQASTRMLCQLLKKKRWFFNETHRTGKDENLS